MSRFNVTDDEIKVLDNPKIIENYRPMYARVLQNGSESWKALAFLKELKSKLTRFGFRLRFNEDKLPTGVVWIIYTMRQHLLQYGDIIFLDA